MAKSRGLPPDLKPRADAHYVDSITSGRTAVGRMIEIDRIRPNPSQPRRDKRDIDELAESIRERGILEPILVRPTDDAQYQIIAGERRYLAARSIGVTLVPCVELDVDERGCLEISLIENLQRRDLTIFEESEAIGRLVDDFSYTHDQVARKMGRSRTSVTELLSLNRMTERVKDACRRADITTKSTLMVIVRAASEAEMLALIAEIEAGGLTRDEVRERKRLGPAAHANEAEGSGAGPAARQRPYVFRYKPPHRDFQLSLRFDREIVQPSELVEILEQILGDLRAQVGNDGGAAMGPVAVAPTGPSVRAVTPDSSH